MRKFRRIQQKAPSANTEERGRQQRNLVGETGNRSEARREGVGEVADSAVRRDAKLVKDDGAGDVSERRKQRREEKGEKMTAQHSV